MWLDAECRPIFQDLLMKGFLNDTNLSSPLQHQTPDRFRNLLEQKMEDARIDTSGSLHSLMAFGLETLLMQP